jgi:hypothetical protein
MRHDGENHFSSCLFLQNLGESRKKRPIDPPGNGRIFHFRLVAAVAAVTHLPLPTVMLAEPMMIPSRADLVE